MSGRSDETAAAPLIRVTAGHPDAEELAVVVAVLTAAASARAGQETPQADVALRWARPAPARRSRPRSWGESRLPR